MADRRPDVFDVGGRRDLVLPFAVMGMTYMSAPDYIRILFITKTGNFLLIIAAFWMSMGVMVMRKMINFKY